MCNWIQDINAQLREKNTRRVVPITISRNKDIKALQCLIVTEKIDPNKRQKPIKLMASYCPFCGCLLEER